MKNWNAFSGAGAMSILLCSTAFADVSNRDVWDSWKGMLTGTGYEVSGAEAESGKTLTISDLVMSFDMSPQEGGARVEMGDLSFEELGDGTVRIIPAESFTMHINAIEEGEASDITILTTMAGLDMVASGDPGKVTYTYSADSMKMVLESLLVNGAPAGEVNFNATAMAVAGTSTTSTSGKIETTQDMTLNSLSIVANGKDETGDMFDMKADVLGLAFKGQGVVPVVDDPNDAAALFRAGFDVDGTFSSEGSTVVISAQEDGAPTNINMSTGKSAFLVKMGTEGAFQYDGSVQDVGMNMVGPDIPLPVVLNMDELAYGFTMPLLKDDKPQDFSARFKLAGLTVSDMLWGIFDPGGMLPRDPATLSLASTGTVTLFEDLVDDSMQDSGDFPGELNALTLTEILVEMVGARIDGAGAFTFDNTDMQTFDGMPRPEGSVKLNAKGLNGLLDTLVAMGLLPEEQVIGASMMMAMFTVPGAGEDEMSSTIEINAEGHVLANGQRIQ